MVNRTKPANHIWLNTTQRKLQHIENKQINFQAYRLAYTRQTITPKLMKYNNTLASETKQYVSVTPLASYSMERLHQYEIIWLEKGYCRIEANNHQLELTTASACLLMPGQALYLTPASHSTGYHIRIAEEYFNLITAHKSYTFCHSNFFNHPWLRLFDEEKSALLHIIITIFRQECTGNKTISRHIMLDWLKLLLNYLDYDNQPQPLPLATIREQQIVQEFLKLLASHFTQLKKVSDYAGKMAVTPTHLNHIIKKTSGYPASFHIQQYIVMEAKRQALNTGKSMKEIAYELGFSDSSHFSKFFKNNTGINFTCFKSSVTDIT